MSVDPSSLMRYVLGLRQAGVTDARILSAMEKAPRAAFAPPAMQRLALEDRPLPIGDGQFSTKPSEAARLIKHLEVAADHRVLEVGSGSGFVTGVIALLSKKVVGLERRRGLVSLARAGLGGLRIMNAHVHHGDGLQGWRDEAPYDRIILHAAAPPFAPRLIEDLADGGRMVGPTGLAGAVRWRVLEKREGRLFERADLGPFEGAALEPGTSEAG